MSFHLPFAIFVHAVLVPVDTLKCEFSVPAEISQIVPASERILRMLGSPDDYDFIVAIQEALANAVVHGSKLDPAKNIYCNAEIDGDHQIVTIRDSGPGFDYSHIPDPTNDEGILKFSGRGLAMIRSVVDDVIFTDGGATIRMSKRKRT